MTGETYEFKRTRLISLSGETMFVFREGDVLRRAVIREAAGGRRKILLKIKRVKRLTREEQADIIAQLDEEEK